MKQMVPDDTLFEENFERHVTDDCHVIFRVLPGDRQSCTEEHVLKIELNKTGRFLCQGVPLSDQDQDDLRRKLKQKIQENMLFWQAGQTEDVSQESAQLVTPEDIVQLHFHPVNNDVPGNNNGADINDNASQRDEEELAGAVGGEARVLSTPAGRQRGETKSSGSAPESDGTGSV
jgi:hypothetical protein